MDTVLLAVILGFILDCIIGDPEWMPHPVRLIGWQIGKGEKILRKMLPSTPKGELLAGTILTLSLIVLNMGMTGAIVWGSYKLHPVMGLGVSGWICYQILAMKALKVESMRVYRSLAEDDLKGARYWVSRIVGRDTDSLTKEQVAKAAIETVAENTSDGIIAPLCYLLLGGPVLGIGYKVINTLDSMIGYKNDQYLYFGRFAAKLDDVVNYIPARMSGYLMIVSSLILGKDWQGSYHIYKRDRYNHKSPNSAHTEAACAGALGIQLAGDAIYFGKVCHKPTIGETTVKVEMGHIKEANKLMIVTCILALLIGGCLRWMI